MVIKFMYRTDSNFGFITAVHVTSANTHDTKEFIKSVKDMHLVRGAFVIADKGYSSNLNRNYLISKYYEDGIV